jgi:hypothetical protein
MPVYTVKYMVRKSASLFAETAQEAASLIKPAIEHEKGLLLSVIRVDLEPPPEAAATGDAA